jgi:GntR family transcriptional regulator
MKPHLPLYAQLKETIISAIANNTYTPGDQLPSQREMCQQYHMSHMTVRRAIADLINEGIIYPIAGKGLYVAPRKQPAEMGSLVSHKEHMTRLGMAPSTRLLNAEIVSASTVSAQMFGIEIGAPLVYLRRLRLGDGKPISILACHLPHHLCEGILEHNLEENSLFETLRNVYHLRLKGSTSTIEAVLASAEQAELLGLALPAALLLKEQLTYLDTGRVIEFSRTFIVPGYNVYVEEGETAGNHQFHFSMRTLSGDKAGSE